MNDGLEGFSDHRAVGFKIVEESREVKSGLKNYYSYCRGDFEGLSERMKSDYFHPYCYSSVDVNVELWYEWLFELINQHVRKRTKRRQNLPFWISNNTTHLLHKLKTQEKKQQKDGRRKPSAKLI